MVGPITKALGVAALSFIAGSLEGCKWFDKATAPDEEKPNIAQQTQTVPILEDFMLKKAQIPPMKDEDKDGDIDGTDGQKWWDAHFKPGILRLEEKFPGIAKEWVPYGRKYVEMKVEEWIAANPDKDGEKAKKAIEEFDKAAEKDKSEWEKTDESNCVRIGNQTH